MADQSSRQLQSGNNARSGRELLDRSGVAELQRRRRAQPPAHLQQQPARTRLGHRVSNQDNIETNLGHAAPSDRAPLHRSDSLIELPELVEGVRLMQSGSPTAQSASWRLAAMQPRGNREASGLYQPPSRKPAPASTGSSHMLSTLANAQVFELPRPGPVFMAFEKRDERDLASAMLNNWEKMADWAARKGMSPAAAHDHFNKILMGYSSRTEEPDWKDEDGVEWRNRGDRNKTASSKHGKKIHKPKSPTSLSLPQKGKGGALSRTSLNLSRTGFAARSAAAHQIGGSSDSSHGSETGTRN